MPNVDFHSSYRDATRGSTIKALQLRQQQIAQEAAQIGQPRRIEHPMQAFGQIAQSIGAGWREASAARDEQAGRKRFAELLAGGLTAEEMGEAIGLDPDTALKYQEHTWETEKEAAAAAAREKELLRSHGWDVDAATAATEAEKAAAAERARVEQESQGRTFGQQDKTAEELAREQEAAKTLENQRKIEQDKLNAEQAEKQATLTAALGSDEAKLAAGLKAGTIDQAAYDQGMESIKAKRAKEAMTPGEDQLERDYAKEHGEWSSTGRAQMVANLEQLKKAAGTLGTEPGVFTKTTGIGATSGLLTGASPDWLNRLIGNQEALTTRDAVRSVAQESLKAVLGSQFAAVEGQQVLERAFDPSATPEENQRRVGLLTAKLEQIAAQREAKAKYYDENGMISGYVGPDMGAAKADFMTLMKDFGGEDTNSGSAAGGGGGAQPELSDEDLLNKYRKK